MLQAIIFRLVYLVGLGAVVVFAAHAQETKEPATAIERFSADSGEVVVKGFEDIGRLDCKYRYKGVVGIARFTNAVTGDVISGLRVSVKGTGQYDSERQSFVDYEEIDGLLAGLNYLKSVDGAVTPLADFEAEFSTEGGFKATVFSNSDGGMSSAITVGKYSSEVCYLEEGALTATRALVVKAKQRLDSL